MASRLDCVLKQEREWQRGLKATVSHWYYFGSGSRVGPVPFCFSNFSTEPVSVSQGVLAALP